MARVEANEDMLAWVREQANTEARWLWPRRRVVEATRMCHRDLDMRLDAMSEGFAARKRYLANIPVLIHPNGVIFAVAVGQTWAALRFPEAGRTAVVRSVWGKRELPPDWVDIDPWLSDAPIQEGLSRLRGWCRAAHEYAGTLAR